MDPGTVADLYQHYVATRQMFGAAAVSQLEQLGVRRFVLLRIDAMVFAHNCKFAQLLSLQVWHLLESIQRTLAKHPQIQREELVTCQQVLRWAHLLHWCFWGCNNSLAICSQGFQLVSYVGTSKTTLPIPRLWKNDWASLSSTDSTWRISIKTELFAGLSRS